MSAAAVALPVPAPPAMTLVAPASAPAECWKRVRRAPRYEVRADGAVRNRLTGRHLRPYLNSRKPGEDYYRVTLRKAGGGKVCYYVHRLVALFHVPGRTRQRCHVHHVNGDHHDNRAENLRWLTPTENLAIRWGQPLSPAVEACPF